MFHYLIASRRQGPQLTGSAGAALLTHVLCIAADIWATLRPGAPVRAEPRPVVITWPAALREGPRGDDWLTAPTPDDVDVPIWAPRPLDISGVGTPLPFDATDWLARRDGLARRHEPQHGGPSCSRGRG